VIDETPISGILIRDLLRPAAGFVTVEEKPGTFGVEVLEERYARSLERTPR